MTVDAYHPNFAKQPLPDDLQSAANRCADIAKSDARAVDEIMREIAALGTKAGQCLTKADENEQRISELKTIVDERVVAEPDVIAAAMTRLLAENPEAIAKALRGLCKDALP